MRGAAQLRVAGEKWRITAGGRWDQARSRRRPLTHERVHRVAANRGDRLVGDGNAAISRAMIDRNIAAISEHLALADQPGISCLRWIAHIPEHPRVEIVLRIRLDEQ